MSVATPNFAAVRPRVSVADRGEPRLLDEVVAELLLELPAGIIRLTGGPGSGKSTALAHLAAVLAGEDRLWFLDEPQLKDLEECPADKLVIATMLPGGGRGIELLLQPWGRDELIEYLLARHHDACGDVIQRLGAAACWSWPPELASVVMERFVADSDLRDPITALLQEVQEGIPDSKQRTVATRFCLASLRRSGDELETAASQLAGIGCPSVVRKLLRHKQVQLPMAVERLIAKVHVGDYIDFEQALPAELVELTGQRCRDNSLVLDRLRRRLALPRGEAAHPMVASVLVAADPTWRPPRRRWWLSGSIFPRVRWSGIDLSGAKLTFCNFRHADLSAAVLDRALLDSARFDGADLRKARCNAASAMNASFCRANLSGAEFGRAQLSRGDFTKADLSDATLVKSNLTGANLSSALFRQANLAEARLSDAILDGADFTNADCRQANFSRTDLRNACFYGASLEQAVFIQAQMEDVRIVDARLRDAVLSGAHLTGSWLPSADLRGARLTDAGLAEIEWENADLRGADLNRVSFHMGSSRSGLVGSPIPCEGSKTGFYTDDLDDMSFKRPEEVRKANLRGADLRGVNAKGVDFYLVDLRDAKLDPALLDQARGSGAILDDALA